MHDSTFVLIFSLIVKGVDTDLLIKESGFCYYLQQLHQFLSRQLGANYVQTKTEKNLLTKGRSVQFTYKGKVAVDLLVSPNWRDEQELYRFLNSTENPRE